MLVVIAIIGILASLLMPSLQKAIDSARGVACSNNFKQISLLLNTYSEEFNGTEIITSDSVGRYNTGLWYMLNWCEFLGYSYLDYKTQPWKKSNMFVCPSLSDGLGPTQATSASYAYLHSDTAPLYTTTGKNHGISGKKLAAIKYGASKVCRLAPHGYLIMGDPTTTFYQDIPYPHNDRANVLFLDSHVEAMPAQLPDWNENNVFWNYN